MKRSWISIFLVAGLLALLGVLAALQYVWLGQISEAEKERMTRRLQTDTERFGEDFNREIQGAYFNFQTDESLWEKKDWAQFNERYDFWRSKTAYQNLIKDFYFFASKPDATLLRYDAEKREFTKTTWTNELQDIKAKTVDEKNFQPVNEEHFALIMPVYEAQKTFERILITIPKKTANEAENIPPAPTKIVLPEKKGFLVIKLDERTVKEQILPDLAKKHFPENDFNLAVVNNDGQVIFQTNEVSAPEKSARLFDISPDNLIFFANRDSLPRSQNVEAKGVIINQSMQTHTVSTLKSGEISADKTPAKQTSGTFQLELREGDQKRAVIRTNLSQNGNWTLNVQHTNGSLDKFIASQRNKNLGISFGILSLLAVCIVLVFVSAQRAKVFARRQIDFVSSVSHEFRTPLAVIYSAGENLADGVAREESQVTRYGDLIKGEGKKLSVMVEQILEFAGANSGRQKYDFRPQSVKEIIEKALGECQAMLVEKGFTVETEIAENLPAIKADANALNRAIQNLIGNALKYSNGEKWLKISAKNGGGRVRIMVEDKGIGIAPKDLKHIFEPFFRSKTVVDEQIHGNGLGLSLVKKTVEAHGGKVSAKSEVGKGSCFTIELPRQEKNEGSTS